MSVTAAALRELHRIHQQLADLRDRLERGPKQVRAREANVAQLEARLAEARDKAKQTQMAVDRKQLDLKSGEQKVVDLRVKLNAANSNREYQALLEQIAAAEMAGSVLSDEILEGMEKVDQLGARGERSRKESGRPASRNWKRPGTPSKTRPRRSAADLTRLEAELAHGRESAARRSQSRLPARRPQQRGRQPGRGRDGVCTGCGQQITLNMQNELKLSKLVFCKSCGRLLYLPGD